MQAAIAQIDHYLNCNAETTLLIKIIGYADIISLNTTNKLLWLNNNLKLAKSRANVIERFLYEKLNRFKMRIIIIPSSCNERYFYRRDNRYVEIFAYDYFEMEDLNGLQ